MAATGFLNHKRVQQNAVLLPNGQVLAVGGSAKNNVAEGSGRISERYDPETGEWTDMAAQEYWRVYHSTALLLPDGRVASLGGNPEQGIYERSHRDLFSVVSLHEQRRIRAAADDDRRTGPDRLCGGLRGDDRRPRGDPGSRADTAGAATHAFDMEQRLVEIEIAAVLGGKLRLVGPPMRTSPRRDITCCS